MLHAQVLRLKDVLLRTVGITTGEELKAAFFEERTAHQQPILGFPGLCLQKRNLIVLASADNARDRGIGCCTSARMRMSQIQQPL